MKRDICHKIEILIEFQNGILYKTHKIINPHNMSHNNPRLIRFRELIQKFHPKLFVIFSAAFFCNIFLRFIFYFIGFIFFIFC